MTFKTPDISAPADPYALDGSDLLAHYSKVHLLAMNPDEFELAYRIVSASKAVSIAWATNLIPVSNKTAKTFKTTAEKLTEIFPMDWYAFSEEGLSVKIPPEFLNQAFSGAIHA